ncbi:calmodulin-binding protein [Musa troglodytarum]|uniref:Calmodulin-binding protein n=1 Tax=Musa troglodytarum TaxID=320322 RepID=A0A9E7FLC1_9LILI|nr:calmodulin-binding protein [Musa troglodytarum]
MAEGNVSTKRETDGDLEHEEEEHCRRPGKHHSKLNVAEGNASTKPETVADLEHEEEEHCRRPGKHHSKLNVAEGDVSSKPETDADLEHEEEEHCRRPEKHHSKPNMAEGYVSTKPETDADLSQASSAGDTSINDITTCEGVNLSRTVADPKPEGTREAQQDHSLHEQQMTVEENNLTGPENVCVEEQEEGGEAVISSELIRRRINSKKGINSYQLGKKLSFKWTTGAGPRIGCVRDYPSELQFRALEQVCLSPTGAGMSRLASPRTARCQSPLTQEKSLLGEVQQQSHTQMTQEKSLLKEVLQQSHIQMTQEKSLLKEVLQQSHIQDNGR